MHYYAHGSGEPHIGVNGERFYRRTPATPIQDAFKGMRCLYLAWEDERRMNGSLIVGGASHEGLIDHIVDGVVTYIPDGSTDRFIAPLSRIWILNEQLIREDVI